MISIHEAAKASTIIINIIFTSCFISIHEAAKASTFYKNNSIIVSSISIHEAAKASTGIDWGELGRNIDFNPRSRKGFDVCSAAGCSPSFPISIHEAAKASTVSTARLKGGQNFNPRSRKGFDDGPHVSFIPCIQFQSTKPQRLRQGQLTKRKEVKRFQSTKPQRLRLKKAWL